MTAPLGGMTTPRAPRPATPATITAIHAGHPLDGSVRLAAAAILEANAQNLTRVLAAPSLTLGQVIASGVPQDDFTLDDAVATITHLVLTCLAHTHRGRGLLDGLPDLPTDVDTLTDCLQLVANEVATWPQSVLPPDMDVAALRSAARYAVDTATRELS